MPAGELGDHRAARGRRAGTARAARGAVRELARGHPEEAAVELEVLGDRERAVEGVGLRHDAEQQLGRARSCARRRPRRRTPGPPVGSTRVVSMPIVVDLPAPFGPRSPKNSPRLDGQVDAVDGTDFAALALNVFDSASVRIGASMWLHFNVCTEDRSSDLLARPLVLASQSPQRRAILEQLGLGFSVVVRTTTSIDPRGCRRRSWRGPRPRQGALGGQVTWCSAWTPTVAWTAARLGKPADAERGGGDAARCWPAAPTWCTPASAWRPRAPSTSAW